MTCSNSFYTTSRYSDANKNNNRYAKNLSQLATTWLGAHCIVFENWKTGGVG